MPDYRVNLDVYNGPMDLLLYLIRREEVDIYDIPIAHIAEQYVRHVEMLKRLDPNLAGDFLVLAATLMEIKTRMLLPAPPPEEGGETGLQIDPRADLVRQLLAYKAFKDAAVELQDAGLRQAMKFPRPGGQIPGGKGELDLEDAQVWDLMEAFTKVMESIGQTITHHEVIYDDTPLELHAADILDRLQRDGTLTFAKIFEGRSRRIEIVGLFLALLELVRQKKVRAMQEGDFGEIVIILREPADGDHAPSAEASERQAAEQTPSEGSYVSEPDVKPNEEAESVG